MRRHKALSRRARSFGRFLLVFFVATCLPTQMSAQENPLACAEARAGLQTALKQTGTQRRDALSELKVSAACKDTAAARGTALAEVQAELKRVRIADEAAWKKARDEGSEVSYKRYLDIYPAGVYAADARRARSKLIEIRGAKERRERDLAAWKTAMDAKTEEAYAQYLAAWPKGDFSDAAARELDVFVQARNAVNEEAAWQSAVTGKSVLSFREYLRVYPAGKYADKAIAEQQRLSSEAIKYLESYQTRCDKKEAWACHYIGYLHLEGIGVPGDLDKAQELFSAACFSGLAAGCEGIVSVGYRYQVGKGVKTDFGKAAKILELVCTDQLTYGCVNLGVLYFNGQGVGVDYKKAHDLYEKDCNGERTLGCAYLGGLYRRGYGVEKNTEKARELYQQSCDAGHAMGCDGLTEIQ